MHTHQHHILTNITLIHTKPPIPGVNAFISTPMLVLSQAEAVVCSRHFGLWSVCWSWLTCSSAHTHFAQGTVLRPCSSLLSDAVINTMMKSSIKKETVRHGWPPSLPCLLTLLPKTLSALLLPRACCLLLMLDVLDDLQQTYTIYLCCYSHSAWPVFIILPDPSLASDTANLTTFWAPLPLPPSDPIWVLFMLVCLSHTDMYYPPTTYILTGSRLWDIYSPILIFGYLLTCIIASYGKMPQLNGC